MRKSQKPQRGRKQKKKQKHLKLALRSPLIPFTGERFVPGYRDGSTDLEHVHRYCVALPLAKNRRVLDIACGEGYGSDLIAQVAHSVTGVELDVHVIDACTRQYRRDNLTFRQGDIFKTPVEDSSFELVVCFETIEHVSEHAKAIMELKRVMTADGVLLISTPDKTKYRANDQPNPFHAKELTGDELRQLLTEKFRHVALYRQEVVFGSLLLPPQAQRCRLDKMEVLRLEPTDGIITKRSDDEEINEYVVALASDTDLPLLSVSIYAGDYPAKAMSALIGGIAERDGIITELREQIGQHELKIEDVRASHDTALSAVRDKLDARTREIAALLEDIAGKDRTINALRDHCCPVDGETRTEKG
jgi:2-polyprenyl-3-methyl-5-hydroxy-6-metoxy-1,4-benzoquinol methylase